MIYEVIKRSVSINGRKHLRGSKIELSDDLYKLYANSLKKIELKNKIKTEVCNEKVNSKKEL